MQITNPTLPEAIKTERMNLLDAIFPWRILIKSLREENKRIKKELDQKDHAWLNLYDRYISLQNRLEFCQKIKNEQINELYKRIASLEAANTKYRKQFGPYKIKGKRAA